MHREEKMKRCNPRIAIVIVMALIVGIISPGISEMKPKVYATSNDIYIEGEPVESFTIDLSDMETMITEENPRIDITDKIPNGIAPRYYSHVIIYYDLVYKDESLKEEILRAEEEKRREEENDDSITLGEEDWEVAYIVASFGADNRTFYEKETKDFEQAKLLPVINFTNSATSLYIAKKNFVIDISCKSYGRKNALGIEGVKVKSIEFVAYEDAVFDVNYATPKPTATPTPMELATPLPTIEPEIDYRCRSGKVENLVFDLSKMQTTFTRSKIWIDFRGQYGVNWYMPENYEALKIRYKVHLLKDELKPDDCSMDNWRLHTIKFSLVYDEELLDGHSNYEVGYANLPSIEKEKVLTWSDDMIGLNIQPMTYLYYSWPQELESITITGLELVAKEGAVYPEESMVTPTPTPTPSVTPTITPNVVVTTPTPEPLGTLQNFKVKVKKKKNITLTWTPLKEADGYEIYRSTKKKSDYKRIGSCSWEKSSFTDKKIKKNKTYFYKMCVYRQSSKNVEYSSYTTSKKAMVRRSAPVYTLARKKTAQGISYINIRMKKWSDSYVEIWVKQRKKKYKKVPLSQANIRKNKRSYNFKSSAKKGTLRFKIRTYRKKKKKKQYSYVKIKRI